MEAVAVDVNPDDRKESSKLGSGVLVARTVPNRGSCGSYILVEGSTA